MSDMDVSEERSTAYKLIKKVPDPGPCCEYLVTGQSGGEYGIGDTIYIYAVGVSGGSCRVADGERVRLCPDGKNRLRLKLENPNAGVRQGENVFVVVKKCW